MVCHGFRPWCCDMGSSSHFMKLVTSSDPHGPSVTDPCLTRCRRCSHPHAHHTLACSSTGKHELSRWRWSAPTHAPHAHLQACTLPPPFPLCLSFAFSSPSSYFSRHFPLTSLALFLSLLSPFSSHFSLSFSSPSERTSNTFYICGPSRRVQSLPQAHPTTRARLP